jgi:hypothetical protein
MEVCGPLIAFLIGYLIFYYIFHKYSSRDLVVGFEKVKDIVRGTINTNGSIKDLYAAYNHFKSTPGVEIIDIKDVGKLEKLQHISVNFIFEDRFIGEMQFRYEKPEDYEASHLIYEVFRSNMKLEILSSLSKQQDYLSKNKMLCSE